MTDRLKCCVPFCRRTFKREDCEGAEVMCGKHWRLASPILRRRHKRLCRCYRRNSLTTGIDREIKLSSLEEALWNRIKAQAIEAAAGIA